MKLPITDNNIPWSRKVAIHIAAVLGELVKRNAGDKLDCEPFHGLSDKDLEKIVLFYAPKAEAAPVDLRIPEAPPSPPAPKAERETTKPKTPVKETAKVPLLTSEAICDACFNGPRDLEELAAELKTTPVALRALAEKADSGFKVWGGKVKLK